MSDASGLSPELKPEINFIYDLLRQLTAGSLRVPKFQRPFVWKRSQMIDLLDSIKRQYPVGSLLAWETDVAISSLASIGPVQVGKSSQTLPAYLLDGHQRLSTLAGALLAPDLELRSDDDDPGRWRIYYNAEDERFEHLATDVMPNASQFPLNRLLDTVEFLDECQRVLVASPERGRSYVAKVQEIARAFQNYKVPVIRIRETNLTEAVEIFARLNSKGQPMTADQMVSALLYRDGADQSFDLSNEIDDIMSELEAQGFEGMDRAIVLRTLLAAAGEAIYRTDWTRIAVARREDLLKRLSGVMTDVKKSLVMAVEFLKRECGVTNARLLPYAMQLVVLACFFFRQPGASEPQRRLLLRWFWVSSFGSWFGGTNPSRVNALVREVMDAVATNVDNPTLVSVDLAAPAQPMSVAFDMRSARTRATVLVLLSLGPLDAQGRLIERPDDGIQRYGPEAISHVVQTVTDRKALSSPANRVIRPSILDRGQARSWLRAVPAGLVDAVCASHAIDPLTLPLLDQQDGTAFVEARYETLAGIERAFMIARDVVPPTSAIPGALVLDTE